MASDRSKAKKDVEQNPSDTSEPPELQSVINSAHNLRHELAKTKEQYRHIETMKDKEIAAGAAEENRALGAFGKYFGGSTNSPIAIASVAVITGILIASFCYVAALYSQKPDSWFHEAEWAGAFAGTSLSFIFGRTGKR